MKIEDTKVKLTSAYVKQDFSGVDKRYEIYDTVVSGFILRITKTGYTSYAFRYWYDGQSKQFTIEKADRISLKKARDIARDCRELVRQGKDPAMERRENRETKPKTFLQIIDEYKVKHFKKLKQSTRDDYVRRLNYFINGYGKNRLKRPIKNFKRTELLNWLEDVADGAPTNAQRMQALLSSVFTFAVNREYIQVNIVRGISFKEQRIRSKTKQENVDFDEDEVQRLWISFNEYNGLAGSFFKLLMILGQRSTETRTMEWKDIDFENMTWLIPLTDTKTDQKHEVPLPSLAIDVLLQLKRKTGNHKYVFNSNVKANTPIVHPSKASQRIRDRSKVSEFNPHSLRTTFVTWQAKLGTPKHITSKLVNHGKNTEGSAVTEIYDKFDYMPQKRIALDKWDRKLYQIITGIVRKDKVAGSIG